MDEKQIMKLSKSSPLKVNMLNKDFHITWHIRKEKYDMLSLYYNKEMRSCKQVIQLYAYSNFHSEVYEFFIPAHQSSWIIRNPLKTKFHSYRITICLKLMDECYLPLLTTVIGDEAMADKLILSDKVSDWSQVCGYSIYEVKQ